MSIKKYTPFPLPVYRFQVDINGTNCKFQEVTGLEQEYDVIEHRYGSDKDLSKAKRLAMVKTSTITMKRGVIKGETTLMDINTEAYENKKYNDDWGENVKLTINLLDEQKVTMATWTVERAYPIKYSFGNLNSQNNDIMVETMEFTHDGLKMNF